MKILVAIVFLLGSVQVWAGNELKGKVLETMDSGGYTYLKLKTAEGERWAAVTQAPVKTGSDVTISEPLLMKNFESKTLKRKFDQIVFGALGGTAAMAAEPAGQTAKGAKAAPKGDPHAGMGGMMGHGMGGAPKEAPKNVKVPKASGPDARTIEEIHAQKAALKDKNVAVRGTVVKYNAGIMGQNWLHIQDGSGSADKKTHDLSVTTQDTAKVGDVVVVRGPVHLDRDIGSGYFFPLIIEKAKLSKE